jgi:DNA-binding MarR family transcriptional regulator/GNAT superfamily N-acetyltransferase
MDTTGRVREFNRYYTQRIGLLTDRYLGQRPLGEARLLFEIGRSGEVSALRSRLGLDSGYLSRLLGSLERQGLIRLARHPADGRARVASLTESGHRELAEQDRLAEARAEELIDPLTPAQRRRLADAMEQVQSLLRVAAVEIRPAGAGSGLGRSCLLAYAAELNERFPEGYALTDLVGEGELEPPHGVLLVASDQNGALGCVGLRTLRQGVGEVRHMWVHPDARRTGLGRRLLRELEAQAVEMGLSELRLSTHESLSEAIAMYHALGYTETPPYGDEIHAHHWFVKRV